MIFSLEEDLIFPNPILSEKNGLLAIGGDLSPDRILLAYTNGIFPWFNPEDEIMWWSSPYRPIYVPGNIKVSKSLKTSLRKRDYIIKLDSNYEELMLNCANVYRKGQDSTWISEEIIESYRELFNQGLLHTIEVWYKGEMVGGLYGTAIGKAFFGESMFQKRSNASKIALYYLSKMLEDWGFLFIDSQVSNPHSFRMGARELSKNDFLKLLEKALDAETRRGPWEYDFSDIRRNL